MNLKKKCLELALMAAVLGVGGQAQAQLLMHFDMNNEGSDSTMGPDKVSGRLGQCIGWVCHTWDNTSLWFNGDYRWVEIADAPELNPANITIEARIFYRSEGPWNWSTILAKESPRAYWVGTAFGSLFATFTGANGTVYDLTGPRIPANQWSTVRYTYDASSMNIYLNGALVATRATGQPLLTTNRSPISMAGTRAGGVTLNSDVDDLKVWSVAFAPGTTPPPPGAPLPVELLVNADDAWTGWLDGATIGGESAWNTVEQRNFSLAPGRHVLAFKVTDLGGSITGFIATLKINGQLRHITGSSGSWKVLGSAPTGAWTSPQYDDSGWGSGFNCGRPGIWGNAPQALYDQGANWIWARDCYQLGEGYIRLSFDVAP